MTSAPNKAMIFDLFNSCASPPVARAAVASIGGPLAERVRVFAQTRDLSAGAFAAREVKHYADRATPSELADLAATMRDADQPVLAGLRLILARAVSRERCVEPSAPEGPWARQDVEAGRRLCA